jgi:hypothetical protein
MPTSNRDFDFVPPEWELTESGSMKFSRPFSLGRYKQKWTDEERAAVKAGGVEAFSSIVERDRREFKKLQDGVDPLEDQDLFDWTLDRDLTPKGEGLSGVWKIMGDIFKGMGDIAYNKLTPKHAYDLGTRPVDTIKDDLATVAGGVTNMSSEAVMLVNGVKNIAMKAWFETDAESRDRKRRFLLSMRNIGRDQDERIGALANWAGMDKDQLARRSEVMGEIFDPIELPLIGKAVFGKSLLPGAVAGLGEELGRTRMARLMSETADGVADPKLVKLEAELQEKYTTASELMNKKLGDVGIGRKATGNVAIGAGKVVEGAGKGLEWVGQKLDDKIDNAAVSNALKAGAASAVLGAGIGGLTTGSVGGAVVGGAFGGAAPAILKNTGRDLAAIGKYWKIGETTQPMLRNLRQDAAVSGLTKWTAGTLDAIDTALRPLTAPAGAGIKGALKGAAVSGAIGGVFGGGESLDTIIQGAAAGAPFGAVAGVGGMWHPYYKVAHEQALRVHQRDLVEDRYVPGTPSRRAWDQLSFEQQTAAAVYLHAHPDVDLQLTEKGAGWQSVVNGRPTIAVNPKSRNPMQMIVAHELGHNALSRGLKPGIQRVLLGSVLEGRPGQYTKLDDDGNPIVSDVLDADGQQQYETTDEFKELKAEYERKLATPFESTDEFKELKADYQKRTKGSGKSTPFEATEEFKQLRDEYEERTVERLSNADAAFEIAAELNADFLINGGFEESVGKNKDVFKLIGNAFSHQIEEGFLRNLLGKMGVAFDEDGPISTPVFKKLRRNKDVQNILKNFYRAQARSKEMPQVSDEDAGVYFTRKEIRENPGIVDNFLNSDDLNIDPQTGLPQGVARIDGKLVIQDESKMYRSPKQIRAARESFAQSIRTAIDNAEGVPDESVQARTTEDGRTEYSGKYFADEILDLIEQEGIHNPHQIAALREINELLKSENGDPMMFFYQPAQNRPVGKRRRVKGAFAGHWRTEVPYGIKIDGNGNILVMMVSTDQLVSNMTRAWIKNKANVQDTWESRQKMIGDMTKYLDNVSNGRGGAEGLGDIKMKKLNALMGIKGTERSEVNPFYGPLNAVSATWLVARRLDRMNKSTPVSGEPLRWGNSQNEQVKGAYMPGAVVDNSIIIPDSEAPKKTKKGYKLFVETDGELYPLFAAQDASGAASAVPVGQWLRAENRRDKKNWRGGKIMAPRPGWHASDLPFTTHLLRKDGTLAPDRVWVEVEMGDDVDWQAEADKRGRIGTKGQWIDGQIRDEIPVGGHYYFKTNSNMTGKWMIGGEIKVNRILTMDEAARIVEEAQNPGSDGGLIGPVYHATDADFAEFDISKSSAADQGLIYFSKVPRKGYGKNVRKFYLRGTVRDVGTSSRGRDRKKNENGDYVFDDGSLAKETVSIEGETVYVGDPSQIIPAEQVEKKLQDGKKVYMPETVRHWSNVEGLTETDPTYHGTGLNGAERQRKKDYPELYQDRTYFGRKGYKPEAGLGRYKYKAALKNSSLYDWEKDPLDIYDEAHERIMESGDYAPMDEVAKITMMEKIIKDRGYSGYLAGNVVAMFDKVRVKAFMPEASTQPAKPEDFQKTPSMVKALKSPGWIAMEGTPQGKTHNSRAGKAGTKKLREWLQNSEYQFMEVEGRYREENGNVQSGPSFLVFGVPEETLPDLAKQFDQESIAYHKGLIYGDGKIVPSRGVLTGKAAGATDYHTFIPYARFPKTFSLKLDFDSAYNPTTGTMEVGDKIINTKGFTERQYEILAKAGSNIRENDEDPSSTKLEIQTDADGNPKFKIDSKSKAYTGVEYVKQSYDMWNTPNALKAAEGLTDKAEREAAIIRMYADGLKRRMEEWKEFPEIMAGHGWYSRMRVKLKNTFKEDTEIFTQMLGALSAQTAVDQNFLYAMEAYEAYKAGKWETNVAKFREGLALLESGELESITNTTTPAKALEAWVETHDLKPYKKNGKLFGANSGALLRVLNGDWLQSVKGPKTPNFQGNLTGRTLEATIDLWAARTIRSIGWEGTEGGRIPPQAEVGVTDVDFFLAQKAFRVAADEMDMNPDDLQAIVWFGEKHVWDEHKWTKNAGAEKSSFDDMYHVFFDAETGDRLDSETAAANLKALKAK